MSKCQKLYYHVTAPENVESILRNGLRPTDGMIFLMTDPMIANTVASQQVFLQRYALLTVDLTGLKCRLIRDNVAEFSAAFHRVVKGQGTIAPNRVKLLGEFDSFTDKPDEWEYFKGQCLGWSREQVDTQYAAVTWMNAELHKLLLGKSKLTEQQIIERGNQMLAKVMPPSATSAGPDISTAKNAKRKKAA